MTCYTGNMKHIWTLNEGIPLNAKDEEDKIGMDTHRHREGIHLWISSRKTAITDEQAELSGIKVGEKYTEMKSVHLTRQDAKNLIDEITDRLF